MDGAIRMDGGPSAAIQWNTTHLNPLVFSYSVEYGSARRIPYSVGAFPWSLMKRSNVWLCALIVGLSVGACDHRPAADSVVGRWERTGGSRAWVQFESNGTFTARAGSDTSLIRGTYTQRGDTVTVVANYTRKMTLRDSILVVEDGTEYRRVDSRP